MTIAVAIPGRAPLELEHVVLDVNGTALSIAVVGLEGVSVAALWAADLACASITGALDVLGDPLVLVATLRP
jgi:hypothetical protein